MIGANGKSESVQPSRSAGTVLLSRFHQTLLYASALLILLLSANQTSYAPKQADTATQAVAHTVAHVAPAEVLVVLVGLVLLLPVLEGTRAGRVASWLILCGTFGAAVVLSHFGHDFLSVLHHGRSSSHFKGALAAGSLLVLGAWQLFRLVRVTLLRSDGTGRDRQPQVLPHLPAAAWALMVVAVISGITMVLPVEGFQDIRHSSAAMEALRKGALFIIELIEQFGISLYLFLLVLRSPGRIRLALRVLILAAFVCVLVALFQYVHLHPTDVASEYSYRGGAIEVKGLMQSRRAYGGMLCVVLPLALGCLLGARSRVVKGFLGVFIGLALLTNLSGPAFWCCLLAMIATGFFYEQKVGLRVAATCALAAAIILGLCPINRQEVVTRFFTYHANYPVSTGADDNAVPASSTTPPAGGEGAAIPAPTPVSANPAVPAPTATTPVPNAAAPTAPVPAPTSVSPQAADNVIVAPPQPVQALPTPTGTDMAPPPPPGAPGGNDDSMPPPPDPGAPMPAPSVPVRPAPVQLPVNRSAPAVRMVPAPVSRAGGRFRGAPPQRADDNAVIPAPTAVGPAGTTTGGDMAPPPEPVAPIRNTNSGDMAPPPGMDVPAPPVQPVPQIVPQGPAPGTRPVNPAPGTVIQPPTVVTPPAPGTVPVPGPNGTTPLPPATTAPVTPVPGGVQVPVTPPGSGGIPQPGEMPPPQDAGTGTVTLPGEATPAAAPSGPSIKKEYEEWIAGIYMASEHLWTGVGPGQYQLNIGQYYGSNPNAEIRLEPDSNNLYTVYGASLGLAGLIALLQLILGGAGKSWRTARNDSPEDEVLLKDASEWQAWWLTREGRALAAGVCGAFTAFLVVNMFTALLVRGTGIIFAFILALAASMPGRMKSSPRDNGM